MGSSESTFDSHHPQSTSGIRTFMIEDRTCLNGPKIKVVNERGSFLDTYDERTRLGSGSFGQVIKARHYLDRSWYAIKIIHFREKDLMEVRKEVENYASLPVHQNIVSYKGCWIENITDYNYALFVRMECCDVDLNSFLRNRNHKFFTEDGYGSSSSNDLRYGRNFKIEDKRNIQVIMNDIITGLCFLHEREIIHRDLKPGNILLKFDRLVNRTIIKIGDFGLAKHFEKTSNGSNTNCGTAVYSAPEQLFCRKYDERVDLFPLGLIYFELLYPMEEGRSNIMQLLKIRDAKEMPQKLIKLHKKECNIILQLLSENPNHRPSLDYVKKIVNAIKFKPVIKIRESQEKKIFFDEGTFNDYINITKPTTA